MINVIKGLVVKGDGYGKKLGFPTMNLEVKSQLPDPGVYAGTAIVEGREYRTGIVIGPGDRAEAHLIGYSGNAYGKTVILKTKSFLREYKKFNKEEELIKQIKEDLRKC